VVPVHAPGIDEVVIASDAVEGGVTETAALDFFVGSALLVAVTLTFTLLETVGAVNIPLLEMVPALADHVTAVLLVPCTAAANCCVLPEPTVTMAGETATLIVGDALTVITALAFLVVSAMLVAVTVTLVLLVTFGAVKRPLLEMLPPVADQETAVLVVPETWVVNC
jgi:hypothetical protein